MPQSLIRAGFTAAGGLGALLGPLATDADASGPAILHNWVNIAGGSFHTATNWNPLGEPGPLDTAVFDVGTLYTVTFSQSATNKLLIIDDVDVTLDRAGCGDPRIDLGMFHARLILDVIEGGLSPAQAHSAFNQLLEAYRHASRKDLTPELNLFVAASLLQCAIEPFRNRHLNWPEKIEAIIAHAVQLAERGPNRV